MLLDPHDELIRLALRLYEKGDDFDTMYDKLMDALKELPKLRYELGVDNFNKNREKEPWIRGKNGEPKLEGGSLEDVSRKTGLPIPVVEQKTIDFFDKSLSFKNLSEYWQESFIEEAVEQVAYNIIGVYDDDDDDNDA